MAEVGIRELKAKASKLIDEVHEHGTRYVITRRGRPVGLLMPIAEAPTTSAEGGAGAVLAELDRLGEEIARGWTSPKTSGEILSEIRR